jgi:hypothetical protein
MTRNPPPPLFSRQPGQKSTPVTGNRGAATASSSKTPRPSAHSRGGGKQGQRQNGLKGEEDEEEEDEVDE